MQFKKFMSAMIVTTSLFLIACAPPLSPTPLPTPSSSQSSTPSTSGQDVKVNSQSCPANELQYLVGQPRTVLQTMRFGGEVRFEEPGQAYTMEFIGSRTRIVIDADGKISAVICG